MGRQRGSRTGSDGTSRHAAQQAVGLTGRALATHQGLITDRSGEGRTVGIVAIDQALVDDARAGLGVVAVSPLKDGGQKTVRLVERGAEQLVVEAIQVGSTSPQACF